MVVEERARRAPSTRSRFTRVVAGLTLAKGFGAVSGFITGPLLARALGASGRGNLAAVLVPLTLIPPVLSFGIPSYAYREIPRGRPPGEVIGSLGLPLLVVGLLIAALAVPISDALADGRETVRLWLIIGFATTPILLLENLFSSCLAALERWRAVALYTSGPFALQLAGIVVLSLIGDLTVATAAAVSIAGWMFALTPAVPMLKAFGRPAFRAAIARRSIVFGTKAWAGGLALLANARLDQFMMITLVSPRTLGLYAVATTLSGASFVATGAMSSPLMTRIGAGESALMARAVRMALVVTVSINLVLSAVTPTFLPLLFGAEFQAAVPMALVLLVAAVPFSAGIVLSSAIQADGAPGIPSLGELIALVITVGGLLALLKPLGGIGAALVSLTAYAASFSFQVVMASRRIGVPVRQFVVPTQADVGWIWDAAARLAVRRGVRA